MEDKWIYLSTPYVDAKANMFEIWEPTCKLVWVKESSNPFTGTSYTLKQKWISNKGTFEWRDVPVVEDFDELNKT